jgi:hypothetical protein
MFYKLTFSALADCKTMFTITFKEGSNEQSVFLFQGRPVYFESNASAPVSYSPAGVQEAPPWQLLPSSKRFSEVCLNILPESAGCFRNDAGFGIQASSELKICSPIPLAPFAGGDDALGLAASDIPLQSSTVDPNQMSINPGIQ